MFTETSAVAAAAGTGTETIPIKRIGETVINSVAQILEPTNRDTRKDIFAVLPQRWRHHLVGQAVFPQVTAVGIDGNWTIGTTTNGAVGRLGKLRGRIGGTNWQRADPLVGCVPNKNQQDVSHGTYGSLYIYIYICVPRRAPFRGR